MDAAGAGDGPPREAPEERTPQTPAPPAVAAPASASGGAAGPSGSGEKPVKRMMKTPYQLDVLEQTYLGARISMFSVLYFLGCV